MLKNMKAKALALLAALAMMLGLGAVAIAPAYADQNTGTLTVTSTNPEAKDKAVSAWRMFDITVSGSGDDASYGYTLESGWRDFFESLDVVAEADNDEAASQKAYDYVKSLAGETNDAEGVDEYNSGAVADFAKKAADWAQATSNSESMNSVKLTDVMFSGSENSYSATFSNVPFGYYVVRPASGSTDVSTPIRGTDAMLVAVVSAKPITVAMKSEYPTVDKTIIDEPGSDPEGTAASDAQIGDTVWFQLESKVPDMSEYSSYVFKFHDTLSNGLTFNESSVTVKVGGTTLKKDTDYTVSPEGQNITIDLTSLYAKYKDQAGAAIVVTYSATLNESAVIGNDGNKNSATVEYTNNPTTGETGTSQPDITKTHTFEFTIDKYTGVAYDGDATRLPGAQFHIVKGETVGDGKTMQFQQKTAGDATDPLVVIPLQSEGTELTPLTTPESGKITVSGLADGTYWIVEDKAPDGYNKLTEPIKVVITANYDETTGELTSHTVTYGDESTAAGNNVIPVQNNKGTLLPGTGGMGTVLFTVAGVALIALGVVWSLKRSKSAGRRH